MSGGQCDPRLPGQDEHSLDRALEDFSDLAGGQSRVAVQDDGDPLFVAESSQGRP